MPKSLKNIEGTVVKSLMPFISKNTLNAVMYLVYNYIKFYSGKKRLKHKINFLLQYIDTTG